MRDRQGEITHLLLEFGADPNKRSGRGESPWELVTRIAGDGLLLPTLPVLKRWLDKR